MQTTFTVALTFALTLGMFNMALADEPNTEQDPNAETQWPAALDFTMQTLGGEQVHLAEKYAGKVVLLVNVASKCGYTPQYAGLESLREEYGEQGLAVVGVPCNQFGGQEPGTSDEIATFCEANYGVEFDMLAKVNVKRKADDQCPLYKYLTDKEKLPEIGSDVKWNFEKFLIGRDGKVIAHYRSKVKPGSEVMTEAIEQALAVEIAE